MSGEARVSLHLDLDTSEAQRKQDSFISQNKNLNAVLNLDISEAVQNFQDFAGQIQNQPVRAQLLLDGTETPQAVTALKLETEEAKTSLQSFLEECRNQSAELQLKLSPESGQAEGSAVLHLDTETAKTEFEDFISYLNAQNPEIQLHLNTDGAEENLETIRKQTEKISPLAQKTTDDVTKNISSISSVLTRLSGIIGTVFSVSVIRNFVSEAKAAWNIQLEAETKLETILGRNIGATKAQIQATKEWASELQSVGVIGDEVQLSGLQELSTYIENADSLKKMNVVLNDMLAQQYGLNATAESAVTISTMLGKVLQGQTAALSRYGYSFTEAQEKLLKYGTEEQRVATLAAVVEESVGGMNEALASTPAGRLKQLENYLGDIKEEFGRAATNLQTIFLPALQRAADLLNAVALKAIEVSEILADMFGIDLSGNFAGSVAAAITETDDFTESVKEAQKAAEKLGSASFDDFNIIGVSESDTESESETEPEITPVLNTSGIQSGISRIQNSVSEKLKNLFQPIQNAWENYGQPFLDSAKNAGKQIRNMFSQIGKSFSEVWQNGTGEQTVSSILDIFRNIYDIIGNISERFALAWSGGTGIDIVQHIADIFQNVLNTVNSITRKTADFAKQIDFSPFLASVDGLLESLEPFTEHIGEGLEWFWENVLLPLAGFTIENLIPDFLNLLSGAVDVLDASVEALKPSGEWLWDEFIKPLADWTGEITTDGLEALAAVLHNIGDWIRDNPNAAAYIGGLTAAFIALSGAVTGGTLLTAAGNIAKFTRKVGALNVTIGVIAAGIVSWGYVITELSKNWEDICDVFEESGGTFGFISGWLEYVRDDVEEFFNFGGFGAKWLEFWEGVGAGFYSFGEELKNAFSRLFQQFSDTWADFQNDFQTGCDMIVRFFTETIPEKWNSLKEDFRLGCEMIAGFFSGLGDGIKEKLAGAWEAVKNIFSSGGAVFQNIENGITSTFRSIVNSLIDGVNSVVRTPFQKINDLLWTIRYFQIGGWYPFWELPEIGIPEIPHLAKGGIVSQPTLAMVGDNPGAQNDPEIVSPLSKLKNLLPEQNHPDTRILESKLDTLIQLAEILIDTIAENQPVLQIGDKEIYAASERGRRKFERMKGVR